VRARAAQAREIGRLLLPQALAEGVEARRLFNRRGWRAGSLRTYRNAWRSRLHLLPTDLDLTDGVVIDLGANEGNFTAAVLAFAPTARVLAVEPAPAARARLEARFAGEPGVTVVPKAVAERSGTATLHLTAHDHNSSLHAPRADMQALYEDPGWGVVETVEVPTVTLDELAGEERIAVVKLDVQGAELEVLRGAGHALANTRAVLMEVTFVSHYHDDAGFQALNRRMLDAGFDLVSISEPGRTASGETTWADACYARR
jgi:FkbM family methyltransferase